jgi:type I site-specific restriction endonuclease
MPSAVFCMNDSIISKQDAKIDSLNEELFNLEKKYNSLREKFQKNEVLLGEFQDSFSSELQYLKIKNDSLFQSGRIHDAALQDSISSLSQTLDAYRSRTEKSRDAFLNLLFVLFLIAVLTIIMIFYRDYRLEKKLKSGFEKSNVAASRELERVKAKSFKRIQRNRQVIKELKKTTDKHTDRLSELARKIKKQAK